MVERDKDEALDEKSAPKNKIIIIIIIVFIFRGGLFLLFSITNITQL